MTPLSVIEFENKRYVHIEGVEAIIKTMEEANAEPKWVLAAVQRYLRGAACRATVKSTCESTDRTREKPQGFVTGSATVPGKELLTDSRELTRVTGRGSFLRNWRKRG